MKRIGIFVDDANMFYAKRKAGMRIDYAVLRDEVLRKGKKVAFASFDATISWEIRRGGPHILLDTLAQNNVEQRQTPSTGLGVLLRNLLYPNEVIGSSEDVDNARPRKNAL